MEYAQTQPVSSIDLRIGSRTCSSKTSEISSSIPGSFNPLICSGENEFELGGEITLEYKQENEVSLFLITVLICSHFMLQEIAALKNARGRTSQLL